MAKPTPDNFRIPTEPVADPSEQGGLVKPEKPSEPALPLAESEEVAVETVKSKVSARYAYDVVVTIGRKKYIYHPDGGAVDESEAINRVVSAHEDLRPWLPGTGKAQWKIKRTSDQPINKDQLTPEQIAALKAPAA